MSVEETLKAIQAEDEERGMRFVALNLRKLLAGALCAQCGEPLGNDDDIDQDDEERTIHGRCKQESEHAEGSDAAA